ncbi:MAG: hypothetical protein ACRCXC_13345 [Legionella sp.]
MGGWPGDWLTLPANTDFKTMIEQLSVAREYKDWLTRKSKGVDVTVAKNLGYYLNHDLRVSLQLHKKELIWPMLRKFIVPEKRELLLNAVKKTAGPHWFFQ